MQQLDRPVSRLEGIITENALQLTEVQAIGVLQYLSFVGRATAETLCITPDFAGAVINIVDHGVSRTFRCEEGHRLRYEYVVQVRDESQQTIERHLGCECAAAVCNLTLSERNLLRGLGRWVVGKEYHQLLQMIGRHVGEPGNDGATLVKEFAEGMSQTQQYLDGLEGRLEEVIERRRFTPGKRGDTNRKKALARGLLVASVNSAKHLLAHHLPIPARLRERLQRAVGILQFRSLSSPASVPLPVAAVRSTAIAVPGVTTELSLSATASARSNLSFRGQMKKLSESGQLALF